MTEATANSAGADKAPAKAKAKSEAPTADVAAALAKQEKTAANAVAAVAAATSGVRRAVKGLPEFRLQLTRASAGDVNNHFAAKMPAGTPFEHVLDPEFWAHTAYKLRAGDEISILADDVSYYGRVYVRAVSAPGAQKLNNRAVVGKLELVEFDKIESGFHSSSHEVKHLGLHKKWCVVSTSDQRVVKEGCGTQEEAQTWVRANRAA